MSNYSTLYKNNQLGKIKIRYTKCVLQGNICDVVRMSFKPKPHIKKISKVSYIRGNYNTQGKFCSDGVVLDVKMKTEPMRNRRSLRKIFVDLRQLINTNFDPERADSQIFLTLTYAENMTDDKKLHNDFRAFNQRLARRLPHYEYINIVEPQSRGAWHCHMLLKFDTPPGFIDYDMVRETWGHGRVYLEKLVDTDNVGAYFVAYFSNLEIPDDAIDEYPDDIIEKNGKRFIKGKRLDMYPDYMMIYRNSKGIIKPETRLGITGIRRDFPVITYENHKELEFVNENGDSSKHDIIKQQRTK